VRSEVLTGTVLLRASIKSVLFSVDANLSGISDAVLRDALKLQRDELERAFTLPVEGITHKSQADYSDTN
jgi:formiminotetrahydrofolate cyclodeaminase